MDETHGEGEVRALERAYDRAWAAADLEGIMACFTDDAVVMNPRGGVARGVAEIRMHLGTFLSGPARGSVHESQVLRVHFVTADVAVLDGQATVRGLVDAPVFVHGFTDVLVRRGGEWRIAHVRAYPLLPDGHLDRPEATAAG